MRATFIFYYSTLWKWYTRTINILLQRSVIAFAVDWSDCMIRINLTKGHFSSTFLLAFFFLCFHGQLLRSIHPATLLLWRVFLSHHAFLCTHCTWWGAWNRGKPAARLVSFSSAPPLAPLSEAMTFSAVLLLRVALGEPGDRDALLWDTLGLWSGSVILQITGFCVCFFVCFLFQIYMILG